jgi:hypothetical protein
MLVIKKQNLNGKVIAIKLISGEEIMAKLISTEDKTIILSNPVSYVMNMNPENPEQGEVMFAPWMLGIDMNSSIEINIDHILYFGAANKDASSKYSEAIGENLNQSITSQNNVRENITTTANNSKSVANISTIVTHKR